MQDDRPVKSLQQNRFADASYRRNVWHVTPEEGTPYEDLFKSLYWTHNQRFLRPGDCIEVHAEDGSYFARLYVRANVDGEIVVAEIDKTEFKDAVPDTGVRHSVEWKGPHRKFGVVRTSDRSVIRDGFQTRDEAMLYLVDLERTVAA